MNPRTLGLALASLALVALPSCSSPQVNRLGPCAAQAGIGLLIGDSPLGTAVEFATCPFVGTEDEIDETFFE